jgi:hypothetical protein
MTFLAAVINVVKTRRLWPRGLQPPLTEADQQVLARAAEQQEMRRGERIRVEFDPTSAAPS